jgi:hypothetical protein
MMPFPLNLSDVGLLIAVESIVLLVTSELISPYYGAANLRIGKKRLRNAAITMSILFFVTVAARIADILLNL